MQTQQKPQTTYTWTQRLTETCTDTNTDTYTCKHRHIPNQKTSQILFSPYPIPNEKINKEKKEKKRKKNN